MDESVKHSSLVRTSAGVMSLAKYTILLHSSEQKRQGIHSQVILSLVFGLANYNRK